MNRDGLTALLPSGLGRLARRGIEAQIQISHLPAASGGPITFSCTPLGLLWLSVEGS